MAPKTNLSGTKFLITAAAVSGTLGGWILLSLIGSGSNAGNGSSQDSAILDLLNQPLPTLAQPNGSFFGPVVNPNTSPANPLTSQQALRRVVAPAQAPGAVAVTRSSRK
jgi:hypothetical protein